MRNSARLVLAPCLAGADGRQAQQRPDLVALVPELRAVAVVAVLQVAQGLVLPLVGRLVQEHVGNEEEPALGVLVAGPDGRVRPGEQAGAQADLPVAAEAAHAGVIPEPLRAARLSEEDVGRDQGTAEVALVPLAPQQIQAAKVLLIPGPRFEQYELLVCLPVSKVGLTNLVHELSSRPGGTSPFCVLPTSDPQF
jgi:hypothetical protein